MAITIGAITESTPGEQRVALVPDVAKKYQALGATVAVESGFALGANLADGDFADVSAAGRDHVLSSSDILLHVQPLDAADLAKLKPGCVLVGYQAPYASAERITALNSASATALSFELLPRISRAQSMDALSSQAAVAGYACVLIGADNCPKFFPMMTYAAGTIRPAKVLVIGAGVAGLQAIATAKRLGAMVEGYDVRPEVREQIESLGAKFVDTGVSAVGTGGYARELTDAEKAQQADKLGKAVAACDVLITTASVPGKRAPQIISEAMVARMKPGAVVVDLAAETGGNVAGTVAGQSVKVGPALIIGPTHIASRMPVHASEMLAKNAFNLISPFIKDGALALDWDDEVIAGSALTHAGQLKSAAVKTALGL
ncbi:MAG: NAD(P) transhydrogenase subunit alpha [Betaproteobacteria bacterium]|jgi:NAD(P) transhydrogenase subunit alpha|nr:NAD(P) transhydrogenase subunit alpha [Betaproteobacteria bacterium]NDF70144.1 NAD(P) transhydrogenase subunit alpha [Betaproteobacteria bacterium]